MIKKCPKCQKSFPLTLEFWGKSRNNKNGFQSRCHDCKRKLDRIYSRQYREKYPEWKKENNKKNLNLVNRLVKEWQKNNPEKCKAQNILNNAVNSGKIKRLPCIICGNEDSEGHHSDYSKPLSVDWLCPKHHKALHYELLTAAEIKMVGLAA